MDFNYSDDRRALAEAFGRYLAKRYPFDTRMANATSERGFSAEQWNEMANLGILSGLFPEDVGGLGGGGFDLAVIFEQIGQALAVEPFLGTLMAGRALAASGGQAELLERAIGGTALLTFAHQEPFSHYTPACVATTALPSDGEWLLTGAKTVVAHLHAADHLIVSARVSGDSTDQAGIGLFLVERAALGLAVRDYALIDGGRAGELTLAGTSARLLMVEAGDLIEQITAIGIVALCWEAVGIMDVIKSMTVEYLRTRKQFGVPIGKFQALQHRMANVAIEIEQARSAAIAAANSLDADRWQRERAASAAKYTIGCAGTIVAEEAIQLHGGIGMTWELPLSHYCKRLIMIGHQLGDEDHHLARFIALNVAA